MPPKATGPFSHKQKVLVPHREDNGSVIFYEARVVKSEKRGELWYYYIHYQGWSKEWDEWVEAPGLHKHDQSLVDGGPKQESDQAQAPQAEPAAQQKGAAQVGQKRAAPGLAKRAEKRRKANDIAPQEAELPNDARDCAVELRLPAALKQVLVDEHECFRKNLHAPALPRTPTVSDILLQYVEHARQTHKSADLEEQAASGLRTYFDKALHQSLLYKHEIEECEKVMAAGIAPSSQYGGEHLLRLLAKLPYLIPISSAPPEGYAILQEQLIAFVAYLKSRMSDYFLPKSQYTAPKSK